MADLNQYVKLHRGQALVMRDRRRFRVVVAGRRWGKTRLSQTCLITAAGNPKSLVWYVAPTYQMARDIMWDELKAAVPQAWMARPPNETRMIIYLLNGARIQLKGADKPDTLRGVGLTFVVIDEAQDIRETTWQEVLLPTLASTNGRALIIGTPKAYNWLYDKYVLGQRGDTYKDEKGNIVANEWRSWQFPTITSPFIPRAEIEARRADMDPRSFRQEFEASFETMSGRVYYAFDRNLHVDDLAIDKTLPLYIGMDFNIDPMSAVVLQEQKNGEIWAIDEIVLYGSNAEETGDEIMSRYFKYANSMSLYPDPAGNNRNHDRGESSIDILREQGFKHIYFKRKHPAVQDRVASVNRLLMSADGQVRLRVDRKCKKLIDSLEQTIYKPGTKEVDKSLGVEHVTDALGYFTDYRHPVRKARILGVEL
ncbi:hypothetical protein FHV99_004670 [Ochrobactrum sp. P20RRXII]|nr:phage terminase large subunit [Ochrobactrum sp. P20RRXII]NIH77418.1 hypothetical protein [Ochrobactrum sp. P20RRXII]